MPELLRPLEDITAVEGKNVRFRCKIAGFPQPQVTWYKDGRKIKSTDSKRIGIVAYLVSFLCDTSFV